MWLPPPEAPVTPVGSVKSGSVAPQGRHAGQAGHSGHGGGADGTGAETDHERQLEHDIEQLTAQVAEQAEQRSGARLLLTHPGVGPVTALATDVFLGDPQRFADGKALASYVGLIPREYSSGARQRLGALTKQGSPLLRFLWNEAGAHAVRRDPELQRFYRRKLVQKGLGKARVAAARKLGIRLWIMLRDQIDYKGWPGRWKSAMIEAKMARCPRIVWKWRVVY